jgi:hypothetical protein
MKTILLTLLVCVSVAHGCVVAYFYRHDTTEPIPLQLAWKVAATAGLYAVLSWSVAFGVLTAMSIKDDLVKPSTEQEAK